MQPNITLLAGYTDIVFLFEKYGSDEDRALNLIMEMILVAGCASLMYKENTFGSEKTSHAW